MSAEGILVMSDRTKDRYLYGVIIIISWVAIVAAAYFRWADDPLIVQAGEPFWVNSDERMCVIVEAEGSYRLACLPESEDGVDR